MANRHAGAVELKGRDQAYTLRLSTNALAEMEDEFDQPITEVIKWMEQKTDFRIREVQRLLRCLLVDAHPDLELNDVGRIIDDTGGVMNAIAKMNEAFQAAMPEPKAGPKAVKKKNAGSRKKKAARSGLMN